ncbi:MAG: cytochrome-c peroxidase [Chitinophagaceae bacterium]|nr:cytochrome-c peroxidase [Chitinophagaceae bacterium]
MRKTSVCIAIIVLFCTTLVLMGFTGNKPSSKVMTAVQLGEKLFFEPMLSKDMSISCASCHKPQFAFADTSAFSLGVGGKLGTRNTPSVMNMTMRESFFWDGRAKSLEEQVVGPIENPIEMNLPFKEAVTRIRNHNGYRKWFYQVYHKLPDSATLVSAIATFERSLETDHTPSDRWLNDEPNEMTASQLRGRELFTSSRTRCFDCHFTPDFTADEFRNIGLFNGQDLHDSGRYHVTKNIDDIGKFKVPGLRNIAMTAPYMHNGQFKTLREVIDYYDEPDKLFHGAINRDTILPKKIGLTEMEKIDLEAFLNALTDDRFTKKGK